MSRSTSSPRRATSFSSPLRRRHKPRQATISSPADLVAAEHARNLEPVDDVMAELIKQNGNVNATVEYLGKIKGSWVAVPATVGSQIKGPCSRIDLMKQHAGIDVQAMYPAGAAANADGWTLDVFLKAAEACHKAGYPFGIGLGTTADNVDTAGRIFHSYGAVLVDANEKITGQVRPRSPGARLLQEAGAIPAARCAGLGRRLQQQVAGRRQGCPDHEPAERLGGGQARCASGCRAAVDPRHAGRAQGPLRAVRALLLGRPGASARTSRRPRACLRTSRNGPAAEKMVAASGGYDIPSFEKLQDFKTWEEEGPPKGTLYHYPNRHNHQILSVAAAPAPPKIAVQIYVQGLMTKMAVRHFQGEAMEKTLAWAEGELEGFMRS